MSHRGRLACPQLTLPCLSPPQGHSKSIQCLTVHKNGGKSYIYSGSHDGHINILSLRARSGATGRRGGSFLFPREEAPPPAGSSQSEQPRPLTRAWVHALATLLMGHFLLCSLEWLLAASAPELLLLPVVTLLAVSFHKQYNY